MPALRAAGGPTPNPSELGNIDYLDSEEKLRLNLHGSKTLSGEVLPQEDDKIAGVVRIEDIGMSGDPKSLQTAELNNRVNNAPKIKVIEKRFSSLIIVRAG